MSADGGTGAMRVVVDSDVWINIFLHDVHKPPKQIYTEIFDGFFDGKFDPIYCAETRDELEWVLKNGKTVGRKYKTDPDDVHRFLQTIFYDSKAGIFVVITNTVFVSSDEADDKFAEAAVVGGAEYLVSNDDHLHEPAVKMYLAPHGCRVKRAYEFRAILRDIP